MRGGKNARGEEEEEEEEERRRTNEVKKEAYTCDILLNPNSRKSGKSFFLSRKLITYLLPMYLACAGQEKYSC